MHLRPRETSDMDKSSQFLDGSLFLERQGAGKPGRKYEDRERGSAIDGTKQQASGHEMIAELRRAAVLRIVRHEDGSRALRRPSAMRAELAVMLLPVLESFQNLSLLGFFVSFTPGDTARSIITDLPLLSLISTCFASQVHRATHRLSSHSVLALRAQITQRLREIGHVICLFLILSTSPFLPDESEISRNVSDIIRHPVHS